MSTLAAQQRDLLALIKDRPVAVQDPYARSLIGSERVALVRTVAVRWRAYQIEAQCRYTSRLLKRLGSFDSRVARYFSEFRSSPHVDELSAEFLREQGRAPEPLVRAVATSELALIRAPLEEFDMVETCWDRNPDLVFRALDRFEELPPREDTQYLLRVAPGSANFLQCWRLSPERAVAAELTG